MDAITKANLVERLRAGKTATNEVAREWGGKLGRQWATSYATEPELRRLSEFVENATEADDIAQHIELADRDAFGAGVAVVEAITGRAETDRLDAREFWDAYGAGDDERCKANDPANRDFLTGFVGGAVGVYDEVRNEL